MKIGIFKGKITFCQSFIRMSILSLLLLILLFSGCSSTPTYRVVYYQPAYRQAPPEPVYSRLMWSHLPAPVRPKSRDDAPLLHPDIFVELKDVSLDEAVEAIAQTMGYRWEYPGIASKGKISIHMEGSVEEVLAEIRKQSNVPLRLDHDRRMIKLADKDTQLKLP
ncbi:MAG TPA: hypothetical protein PKA63_13185 [Oligoflexia bacterium]|nr:hypothetical protein [Oligoflexia bacterium]HMP49614.1 hypothetical protein [Oligoflexia bacterium]